MEWDENAVCTFHINLKFCAVTITYFVIQNNNRKTESSFLPVIVLANGSNLKPLQIVLDQT